MEPISILLINALAADFNFNILDQDVAQPVQPAEALGSRDAHVGQLNAQVHAVDQITVAADGGSHFLAPVRGTIDTLSLGFP